MDGIDSLKFDVLLVDDKYKQEVDACIDRANKLNKTLTEALGSIRAKKFVSDAGVKNIEKAASAFERIREAMASMPSGSGLYGDADALNKTLQQVNANLDKMVAKQGEVKQKTDESANAQKRMNDYAKKTSTSLMSMSKILRLITQLTGVYFGAMGIRRFLSSMIEITGQFEVQRMALRNMLQDVDAADKIFHDLYKFSSDSTYRFSELAKYAKQLAAFNIDKNDLLETTKMLGDVASGVGVSMDRIILAYGHVKSSGFLRGIQLRSFSQNGVPVLEELSKILTEVEGKTVSLGDVFDKMMKRQIPFEMVEQAFKNMTSEGGKFYQMQEVLAKTLSGQINILKGRWENMLAAIGESNSGFLKGTVAKLNDLVLNYEKLGKLIGELILVWGAYRAAVIATTLVTKGLTAATDIGLLKALKSVGKWIMTNPWAVLAAAITYCTIEIVKASRELEDFQKITKALDDVTSEYNRAADTEIAELDALFAALKNANEGTEEYNSAKLALQKRFDPYIQKLREEGVEVNNLATLYEGLANKIIEANKQRFLEDAQKALSDAYANAQKNIEAKTQVVMSQMGNLTPEQEGAIRHFIRTGEMNDNFNSIANLDARRTPGPYENSYQTKEDRKSFRERLSGIRIEYERDTDAFTQGMKDATTRFYESVVATSGSNTQKLKEWRRSVQTTLYTIDDKFEDSLMPKETEDYFEYLERMGKHYKEVNEFKDKALEKDKHIYEAELDAIKKVDAALEGNILKDARYTREPWKGGSGGSSDPFAKEISNTRARISILEKYKSAYERLEAVFGDETDSIFAKLFPQADANNIDSELETLLAHLETLGENGKIAAESLRASLGMDEVSKAIKQQQAAQKALDAYDKALAKFDKDWGDGATGIAGKAEKAIRDYHNEVKKIEKEYIELKEAGAKANKDEEKSWEDLYKARNKANDAKLKDAVDGLADDIFKKLMEGFDLTDWGDKSLGQIKDIENALKNVGVPPEVVLLLKDYPILLANLDAAIKKLANKKLENTVEPEKLKKIASYASDAADMVSKFTDSLSDLFGDSTNRSLREISDGLSDISDMATKVTKAYSKASEMWGKSDGKGIGGLFGSAASAGAAASWLAAIVALNMKVLQLAAMEEEANRRQAAAAREARSTGRLQDTENGSFFGTSQTALIDSRIKQIERIRKSMKSYQDEVDDFYATVKHYGFWQKALGWMHPENWKGGDYLPDTRNSLSLIAENLGMQLYDKYNNLNATTLQAILDTYEDITEEERAWIEQAIADSEDYAEAIADIEDSLESVFGDMASDAADNVIDKWIEMGSAALDYADILDDVAKRYAKMLIESAILDKVLNEDEASRVAEMFVNGRTDEAMRAIANDMEQIAGMEPLFAQILSTFDPYFNHGDSSGTGSGLGNGIKSITEDTANLLASYLNAIRADVSYIRVMQERGWENINAFGQSLPTLSEYIAQVSANTYDTAQNTNRILSELQSVIGAPGTSGMVVRVEYA